MAKLVMAILKKIQFRYSAREKFKQKYKDSNWPIAAVIFKCSCNALVQSLT